MKAKIKNISLLFVLAIALAFSACKETMRTDLVENTIEFDTLYAVKSYHLEGDSTKPSCSVKLSYTYPLVSDTVPVADLILQELNYQFFDGSEYVGLTPDNAAALFVTNYIANYTQEAATTFGDWAKSGKPVEYYSYYKIIESEILFSKSGLVSYQIKTIDYKGELTSSVNYRNLVFDLKTGKVLTETAIFKDDYQTQLNKLLIGRLLQMYKQDTIDDLLQEGFYDLKDITANSNFSVDENGLTYIYNTRTIASPALGEIRIFLSYAQLKNILKENSPITTLLVK